MSLSRRDALIASGTALAGLSLSAPDSSAQGSPSQPAGNSAEPRFPKLKPEEMYFEQRRVAEAVNERRDGGLVGPFVPLSYAPGILDRQQMLGEHCRYSTNVPPKLREWTIAIAARHMNSPGVFSAHARLAEAGGSAKRDEARWGKPANGIAKESMEALANRRRPPKLDDDEALIYDFFTEFNDTGEVSDAIFDRVEQRFGKSVIIDLIAIYAHYGTLGWVFNVSAAPVASRPFPDQAE
ncbi:carboxymuconolactone decarboxylase family protein [Peristeroidobacter soli]|uniref:hypothetical protein n=1 Tax=Peristeroidobacter soli TaxID=2497877 RepID=UPI00101DBFB7|nr:hypothetical protein [Peristeroidobacter soli]